MSLEVMEGEVRVAGLEVEVGLRGTAQERPWERQAGLNLVGEVAEGASVPILVVLELLALQGWWWYTGEAFAE